MIRYDYNIITGHYFWSEPLPLTRRERRERDRLVSSINESCKEATKAAMKASVAIENMKKALGVAGLINPRPW